MKKQILLFLLLAFTTVVHAQSVVETHTFYSAALGVEKSYLIYLPDGYSSDTAHYPSLYFLRLAETEWFDPGLRANGKTLKDVADSLITSGTIGKMILVGPSTGVNTGIGFGIVNMLRPDLATDSLIGTGEFEDYFFQDLIPHIDSAYRTIPNWCARGVDGFSLGGFASTLYSLKHPGVFSSVGGYDGTLMWYNLDYPVTPGPWDDKNWFSSGIATAAVPMFGSPTDTAYMLAHSVTNILTQADPVTLDSIRQMSFHISCSSFNFSNREVNKQFVDSLAAKGIVNSFPNVVLQPGAQHTYDRADQHASKTLPMHWATFASFSCAEEIILGINNVTTSSQSITLFQNYPNPVSSMSTIAFEVPEKSSIKIEIYDSFGNKIRELVNGNFPSGKHQIQLNVAGFPDGVYYYRLESATQILTKKLLVLKDA